MSILRLRSTLHVPTATVDVLLPGGAKPILTSNTTQEGLFAFAGVPAGTDWLPPGTIARRLRCARE